MCLCVQLALILFPKNASQCYRIGLKLTDFAHSGYNNFAKMYNWSIFTRLRGQKI